MKRSIAPWTNRSKKKKKERKEKREKKEKPDIISTTGTILKVPSR